MLLARGLILTVFVFLFTDKRVIAGGSGCNNLTQTIDLSYNQAGSIYSPGYPNNYGTYENCRWLIQAPSYWDKVLIYFTTFDLEDDNQCSYDSVEIFDGHDSSAPRLLKSCGSSLPSPVYSSGRYIYIKFKSDSSVSGRGFVAHYRVLNSSSGSGCNGLTQTISLSYNQTGSIYSPGYPNNYGTYENCRWVIKAPTYSERVLIFFSTFDLENCYECDSVEIFDGSTSSASRLSKSSGSSLPLPVYSSGRYIYMQFTSDSSGSGQGFVAHYRALNRLSGCPPIVPGASAGVIYSPNFPWYYPNSKSCNWYITPPDGKMINLKFTKFIVGSSDRCNDYVEVRKQYYSLIGKYCGSQIPSSITVSGSIRVRFYSNYYSSYRGFMAFYQTGYSFPTSTPYPYWTTYPPAASTYTCDPYSQTSIFVGSSSSASISSRNRYGYYHTNPPKMKCTFKIDTTKGYILELSFQDISISSCSGSYSGYIKVRDGTSSTAQLLGTFCRDYHDTVSSNGNHMFVEYYGRYSWDSFRATVRSKKGTPVNVAAIAVPIVVAIVLFLIIFVVIKCTKIRPSGGPAESSPVNEVIPLQSLPYSIELPPHTTQVLSSSTEHGSTLLPQPANAGLVSHATSQPLAPNTELVPPPYSGPFATVSDSLPSSTDCSQGVVNMSLEDGPVQHFQDGRS